MERGTRIAVLPRIFLGLAILGTALPLAAFLPWVIQHGLDAPRFLAELFGSRIGAFFAWDVVVGAMTVLLAAFVVPGITGAQRAVVTLGTLLVGVSCGLPLLLYFWVRAGKMG